MNEEINNELSEMGSSLAGHRVAMPYTAPAAYFGHTADMAEGIMAAHAGEAVIPASVQPYSVPVGYFDALPGKVLQRASGNERRGGIFSFAQLRWAAAAVVLLMVGAGIWASLNNEVPAPANILLADVADREIQEYLVLSGIGAETEMRAAVTAQEVNVDPRDIITYLDETGWVMN